MNKNNRRYLELLTQTKENEYTVKMNYAIETSILKLVRGLAAVQTKNQRTGQKNNLLTKK